MKRFFLFTFFLIGSCPLLYSQAVIPLPNKQEVLKGYCVIKNIQYILINENNQKQAAFINKELFGNRLIPINKFRLDSCFNLIANKNNFPEEKYSMSTTANAIQIISYGDGFIRAAMTLKQLLLQNPNQIPIQEFFDEPEFQWRGMHLDVSRHFFSVDVVKKYIDLLALYKFNTFHWHLTDDQGWRIEIKKYPLLTEIGSKRSETILEKNFEPYIGDDTEHGGFYTQKEIKEIVQYAADRAITVVPEIEMPGHSAAAIAAYPFLSCQQKSIEPLTKWGVSDDVFCTRDTVFQFLFNVLDEVLTLFPSKYIHIGGDEVPKNRWQHCPHCQLNKKEKKLIDENALQSFFISKIDSFLTARGRNTIGWDEILEGGLAPNAAVMSWRGEEGGIEAAKQNHYAVMTPGAYCYFDHYQGDKKTEPLAIGGFTSLKKVFSYYPIPEKMPPAQQKYILGAQANLWTEYIATPDHLFYMALPRMCALSEVLWCGKRKPDFESFINRLENHFVFLQNLKINYATSMYDVYATLQVKHDALWLIPNADVLRGDIFYSLNGREPDDKSSKFENAIAITQSGTVKMAQLFYGKYFGKVLQMDFLIHKAVAKKISFKNNPSDRYNNGGANTLVDGIVGSLPWSSKEWLGWNENKEMEALIDLSKTEKINNINISFLHSPESWIHAPEQVFYATSKDGIHFTEWKAIPIKIASDCKASIQTKFKTRYIKILAKPLSAIPQGNAGAGAAPWLFCSEIIIE